MPLECTTDTPDTPTPCTCCPQGVGTSACWDRAYETGQEEPPHGDLPRPRQGLRRPCHPGLRGAGRNGIDPIADAGNSQRNAERVR